jgi:hypothetical protein
VLVRHQLTTAVHSGKRIGPALALRWNNDCHELLQRRPLRGSTQHMVVLTRPMLCLSPAEKDLEQLYLEHVKKSYLKIDHAL